MAIGQRLYEACFKEWYTDKFLRGDRRPGCLDEWEASENPYSAPEPMNMSMLFLTANYTGLQGMYG